MVVEVGQKRVPVIRPNAVKNDLTKKMLTRTVSRNGLPMTTWSLKTQD